MRLQGIAAGDVALVDKKGRRFYVLVTHRENGRLDFEPLSRGISYRSASAREVVQLWRATRRDSPRSYSNGRPQHGPAPCTEELAGGAVQARARVGPALEGERRR